MMIPERFLDDLRARANLADLVGRRVRLARRGGRYKGLCPFHNEKSPSFTVEADHFHCFGCGAHGDAIEWLCRAEGHDFVGAVEELAALLGLEVPREAVPGQAGPRREPHGGSSPAGEKTRADSLSAEDAARASLAAAAAEYAAELRGGGFGWVREILTARAIDDAQIEAFHIGWAPGHENNQGLYQRLRRQGFSDAALVDAGLALATENGGRLWDRFRQRIMVPIHDAKGRVVGFGGRAVHKDTPAKYINSPEGPLFDKGRLLFNLHRARASVQQAGRQLFIVEGYMDVIALHGAGIHHAVATMGTAVTEYQLQLAWRVAPVPVIAFDGDAAGQAAMRRVLELALPHIRPGRSLDFLLLPSGKDPDDFLRAHAVAKRQAAFLALPRCRLSEFLWLAGWRNDDGSEPASVEDRAAAEARLRGWVELIRDAILQRHIGDLVDARIDAARAAGVHDALPRFVPAVPLSDADLRAVLAPLQAAMQQPRQAAWLGDRWLRLGGAAGDVVPMAQSLATLAGLGVARVHVRATDHCWQFDAEAEDRAGEPALILPVADRHGALLDLLALDATDDGFYAPKLRAASLYGERALLEARRLNGPLRLFETPAALLRAYAASTAFGDRIEPDRWGCVVLDVFLDIEAAFAGIGALIVETEEAGLRWRDRLEQARRTRRARERALPAIWLPDRAAASGDDASEAGDAGDADDEDADSSGV